MKILWQPLRRFREIIILFSLDQTIIVVEGRRLPVFCFMWPSVVWSILELFDGLIASFVQFFLQIYSKSTINIFEYGEV